MLRSHSDRTIYFTACAADRHVNRVVNQYNDLTKLLNLVREVNAEAVHYKHRNRLHYVHSDRQVFDWGHDNGLVSKYEYNLYFTRIYSRKH